MNSKFPSSTRNCDFLIWQKLLVPSFTPSSKFPHLPSASYSKPLCLSPAWGRAGLARVGGPARRTRVNAPALSQWCKEIRLLTISVSPSGTARRCALHHIPSLGHLPADIPCVGFPVLLGHSLLVLKSCLKMCFWGLLPCPPAMAEMESQDLLPPWINSRHNKTGTWQV